MKPIFSIVMLFLFYIDRILQEWSFHMKLMKRAFGEFKNKRIVDTDIVNDVTSTYQSVITRVVIQFL